MSTTYVSATLIDAASPLNIQELARLCGTKPEWVMQVVEVGILSPQDQGNSTEWHFVSADVSRALEARRLEYQMGANLDSVAMMMDLIQELRKAKALLRTYGLELS